MADTIEITANHQTLDQINAANSTLTEEFILAFTIRDNLHNELEKLHKDIAELILRQEYLEQVRQSLLQTSPKPS